MGGMRPRRECHWEWRMSCCLGLQSVCWRNAVAPTHILSWESSTSCCSENYYCCGLVRKQGICPILLETIFWRHVLCLWLNGVPFFWVKHQRLVIGFGSGAWAQALLLTSCVTWENYLSESGSVFSSIKWEHTHIPLRGLFWDSVYGKF